MPLPAAAQDAAQAEASQPEAENERTIIVADRIRDDYLTVIGNGELEYIRFTGKSVSIFFGEDFDAVQGADLTRVLERAPGVAISRNGGPGNFTAVRVRGAEGEQLLVVLDGVRVADPASPGGGFDFGNLLMGNLEKVELLRSSNSTIWGSQALGGVLLATTLSEPDRRASVEYGRDGSFYGNAGANYEFGHASLGVHAGHFSSDGFSAAAGGTEADGFRQTEVAARGSVTLTDEIEAFASGRHADGRLEIDGFPAPAFVLADTDEYQKTRQRSGAAGLHYDRDELELTATASLADTERDNFDPATGSAPGFTTDGESERVELRGRWRESGGIVRGWAVHFGAEREWSRFSTLFDPLQRTAIAGAYAQVEYDSDRMHFAAGLRRDEHRDFGGEWSLGADAAVELGHDWRFTASYGEGFKAPTLFQLHSDFGNGLLQPERSRSYDLGVEFDGHSADVTLTAFRRDTQGLVGFISCFGTATGICTDRPFGTYDNIGSARAQGLEAEVNGRVGYDFEFGAAYTLLYAEDRTAGSATFGNDLARRPKHALTVAGDWTPGQVVTLGADLRVVSGSFDDAANTVRLGGYAVLTLRGEWDASEYVTLFGRVENVWDESYQTAAGYATPGRGAYVGARARF